MRCFTNCCCALNAPRSCGVLVNTSFNVRGEPIVCTPEDAYRCFVHTEMDYLVMGNFLLDRAEQPARPAIGAWRRKRTEHEAET